MQTMTSASWDADVAELPQRRHLTGPGKTFTLRQLPHASPPPENRSGYGRLYQAISLVSVKIWETASRHARLRAGLPRGAAGSRHGPAGVARRGIRSG